MRLMKYLIAGTVVLGAAWMVFCAILDGDPQYGDCGTDAGWSDYRAQKGWRFR